MLSSVTPTSKNSGFSLIELLIVVAVIAVIAALAIPRMRESTMAANEASAITYLRNWVSAQELYHIKHGVYSDDEDDLVDEGLIGAADDEVNGYEFDLDDGSKYTWWGEAEPDIPGATGKRYFYIDQTGVIRWSTSGDADSNSPPL
ncbi:prepilin-type N-terminal cleavage/methylation domain-containing protein [Acidobacteria bacterium AH-259-A15]|nr:prepilin-type N-terminal cleavage/methylation domain-containing protein [Acidobacteria bacterium AH-259-A15]